MGSQDERLHPNGQPTSEAAFELHVTATAISAAYDRAGFIPAGELAALSRRGVGGPGADLASLAAELCKALLWKQVAGGYRVLDAEAVEVCADRVRELRGEPKVPRGRRLEPTPPDRATPEEVARFGEPNSQGDGVSFRCARCGEVAGIVGVAGAGTAADAWPPLGRPWPKYRGRLVLERFLDGHSRAVSRDVLEAMQALIDQGSVDPAAIRELDWEFWALTPFYCPDCGLNYCAGHWDIARSESEGFREPAMGRCPVGHEHMVDENLSPEPDRAPFVRLDRSRSFDGEEHVVSAAAWDLHLDATTDSVREHRPGFVPDGYLTYLDDQEPGATVLVQELVSSRCWERADDGYRVCDWILVERTVDYIAEGYRRAARNHWLSLRTEQEEALKNADRARQDK